MVSGIYDVYLIPNSFNNFSALFLRNNVLLVMAGGSKFTIPISVSPRMEL